MITMTTIPIVAGVGAEIYDWFNRSKISEQQNQLDNSVANLHKVAEDLNSLNKSTQELQSKVDVIQAPSRPPWPFSLFWSKISEQQNELDNGVANLHKVTEDLNSITIQLNKSRQELQNKVDVIQAPSRPPWPLSLFW
ncbi:unnamed protein product [Prunus brigantina]